MQDWETAVDVLLEACNKLARRELDNVCLLTAQARLSFDMVLQQVLQQLVVNKCFKSFSSLSPVLCMHRGYARVIDAGGRPEGHKA